MPLRDAGENAGREDNRLLAAELALILSGATAEGLGEAEN